jgi:hypothetical protein
MKRTIEIDDTLQDCVNSAIEDIKEYLDGWLDDNHTGDTEEPEAPDIGNDLDYDGRVHEIIDGSVPIYTAEIKDIFYLHGEDVEGAFDDAGFGEKYDAKWPSGWRAAAIYCYIELKVNEWYSDNADFLVEQWWAKNRPAAVANREHDDGDFDGLVVNDTADVPEDYSGSVLHVTDHGNLTLYESDAGELDEIDAIV